VGPLHHRYTQRLRPIKRSAWHFLAVDKARHKQRAGVTWPTRRIQANHHPDTTTTDIRATVATIAGDGGIASRMDSDNLEWMHNEDDEIDDETGGDDF